MLRIQTRTRTCHYKLWEADGTGRAAQTARSGDQRWAAGRRRGARLSCASPALPKASLPFSAASAASACARVENSTCVRSVAGMVLVAGKVVNGSTVHSPAPARARGLPAESVSNQRREEDRSLAGRCAHARTVGAERLLDPFKGRALGNIQHEELRSLLVGQRVSFVSPHPLEMPGQRGRTDGKLLTKRRAFFPSCVAVAAGRSCFDFLSCLDHTTLTRMRK